MNNEAKKNSTATNVKLFNDPGNVLILVYVLIIIFLLLVGNLATASTEDQIKKANPFSEVLTKQPNRQL